MKKFLVGAIGIMMVVAACGTSKQSATSTAKDTTSTSTNRSLYHCVSQYVDTSIQATPLWEESFDVDASAAENPSHKFGVSPGTDTYFAWVGVNKPDGVALMIANETTSDRSTAVFEHGYKSPMLMVSKGQNQTMALACSLAE